jgi:hypothetical protein
MHGLTAWLKSRVRGWPYPKLHRLPECRELLKSAGPGDGLLEVIHFRRIADDDPDNKDALVWELQIRQPILAVDGSKLPMKGPRTLSNPLTASSVSPAAVAWCRLWPRR